MSSKVKQPVQKVYLGLYSAVSCLRYSLTSITFLYLLLWSLQVLKHRPPYPFPNKLFMMHIKSQVPPVIDRHHFAYKANKSNNEAFSIALHTVLQHLEQKGSYARLLFIDCCSAFNTMLHNKLVTKLHHLGFSAQFCNWMLSFLTNHRNTSSILILNM